MRVGSDKNAKAHFVGSVVYIAAEETSANITRWLLIDGQQRLTTVTLLLAALRNRLSPVDVITPEAIDEAAMPTRAELEDYYLRSTHGKGGTPGTNCIWRSMTMRLWPRCLMPKQELPKCRVGTHRHELCVF